MKPFIFFCNLILFFENVNILISYCPRDTPYIIQVGPPNYHYINLITTENGDLIYSASSYPNNNYRIFFGLNKEGKGYFNKYNRRTEFNTITLNDGNNLGRFEF